VVHLRSLRPEFVRDAFPRYRITHMALVPMILRNLETGLRRRFDELPPLRRAALEAARGTYRLLARGRPRPALARRLLRPVHDAFGGKLEALFVGGAYTDPDTIRFFHGLGIAVANGYGLTEAGTALTLDDLSPPRPDTVGVPLPGVELEIDAPGPDGVGEVLAKSATVMKGYLDEPALTAETIEDGWLRTGDLGRMVDGALQIVGRKKNMIVTAGGKNVYPEDVEVAYEGLPVKELCLFAAGYVWPGPGAGERLVLAVRRDAESPPEARILEEVAARNRALPEYQRATGVLFVDGDFPRTASMKVKRAELARHLGDHTGPDEVRDLP
jgi:long-chain acyl-CoA synthetase